MLYLGIDKIGPESSIPTIDITPEKSNLSVEKQNENRSLCAKDLCFI